MELRRTTPNGILVCSYSQPHLHSFSRGLYVRAGVLYEGSEEAGITHFLEHVLFRNLAGMPQRELYEKLESMGATFDACTYKEFLYFSISAVTRRFDECAEIFTRLLAPLSVSAGDVATERKRVQNEIREDDPLGSFDTFAKRRVWGDCELARPILGSITGVAKIGLGKLRAAKEEIFRAQNMCFYVTGSFSDANIGHLCDYAGAYAVARGGEERLTAARLPADFMHRDEALVIRETSDMPSVYYSFDVDYTRYTMAEMHLLDDLLFRGTLSRLGLQLSEKYGLVYSHDAYIDQYRNGGTLFVKFSVMQSRLYDALKITTDVFRSMKEHISQTDLGFHLPIYYDNYDMTFDDPEDLNWHMAYNNFILDNRLKSIEYIKSLYGAVTPARLMEISNELFKSENLVVAIECRKKKCDEEKVVEILASL
jgi:predicted Zn-dependent peptidase